MCCHQKKSGCHLLLLSRDVSPIACNVCNKYSCEIPRQILHCKFSESPCLLNFLSFSHKHTHCFLYFQTKLRTTVCFTCALFCRHAFTLVVVVVAFILSVETMSTIANNANAFLYIFLGISPSLLTLYNYYIYIYFLPMKTP